MLSEIQSGGYLRDESSPAFQRPKTMNCMNHVRVVALAVLFTVFNVNGETVLSLDVNSRSADTPGITLAGFSTFIMRGAAGSIQSTPTTRTYGRSLGDCRRHCGQRRQPRDRQLRRFATEPRR